MEELYNIGISENTVKEMLEVNPDIKDLDNKEVSIKEDILKNMGCNNNEILNIISSNPLFLNEANDKTINLINYLKELGFNTLNILFDSNPYILNLDIFEIKNYIQKEVNNGKDISDIIDELDSNPLLFNEM